MFVSTAYGRNPLVTPLKCLTCSRSDWSEASVSLRSRDLPNGEAVRPQHEPFMTTCRMFPAELMARL